MAFTEHGAIMAANVLNSPRAVMMSFPLQPVISLKKNFLSLTLQIFS
jgi:hypothetical protein